MSAKAQAEFIGQVNAYIKVLEVGSCMLTVDNAAAFEADDWFIIMQMGGATVDGDGNFTGMGHTGYWELHSVKEPPGPGDNRIKTKRAIKNPGNFDPTKFVQVIKLPPVGTNINGRVTGLVLGQGWDPFSGTGGVIAIRVPGILTLNANIDATGIGYGSSYGFLPEGRSAAFCGQTAATVPSDAGFKGDGAATTGVQFGRGRWGTGGGGGMNHNAGGGGGSNYGAGGNGGRELEVFRCTAAENGGLGGSPYTAYTFPDPQKVMMGGGGGSGHQNNAGGGDGGRGGGIVILIAPGGIAGGSFTIRANGADGGNGTDDGAGGGGGGGAILLYSYGPMSSSIKMEVKGGNGGNVAISGNEKVGPGGGGGGGILLSTFFPVATAANVDGGEAGEIQPGGSNHSATDGTDGYRPPPPGPPPPPQPPPLLNVEYGGQDNESFTMITDPPNAPVKFCEGGSVKLVVDKDDAVWTKVNDPSFTHTGRSITVTASGTYIVEATLGECILIATKEVTVWKKPQYTFGGVEWLPPCGIDSFRMGTEEGAFFGTGPYTYRWETDDPDAINPDDLSNQMVWAKPTKNTRFKITVTDANGCIFTDTFNYRYFPPIIYHAPDTSTCAGTDVRIGTTIQGGKAPFQYIWTPAAGLDNPTIEQPTVLAPTANQRYIVQITDGNTCRIFDTIFVTVKPLPTTSISANVTICPGEGAPLVAAGGTRYVWSPATGLSCANCPNPTARPAATTTYSVLITDAKGCSRTESVTVSVRTPRIQANVPSLDFGTLEGCQTTAQLSFFLRNLDNADIDVDNPVFSNPGFAVIDPPLPATIKANDSIRVTVRFSPIAAGTATSTLTLTGLCGVTASIDLSGTQPTTAVSANLGVIGFGQSLDCDPAPRDSFVVVTNTGTAPISFAIPTVAAPFQVLHPVGGVSVAPGDTIHVVVRYAPTAPGAAASDLLLPYVAGACEDTLRVALNGTSIRPLATVDLTTIQFPELVGCNLNSDTTITITNTGLTAVDLAATIPPGFRLISAVPPSLEPNQSVAITVRFEPIAQGPATGILTIVYGPCDDTIRVDLSGSSQGVSFAITDSVNFGAIVFCQNQTSTLPFRITNTSAGNAAATVTDVFTTGPFSVTLTPGQTLANGIEQLFDVTFQPTADGPITGTIEITLDPCGVRRTIQLTGTRTDAVLAVTGPAAINFGSVPITQNRTDIVRFTNTGSAVIRNITLANIAPPFAVISATPPIPATLAPGEELVVEVQYTGTGGTQNGSIQAESEDPCLSTALVTLTGTGDAAATSVAIPDFAAAPGQQVIVPIIATGTADLPAVGVTDFTTTIRFPRRILILARQTAPAVTTDNLRADPANAESMLYTFTAPFRAGDTLSTLKFIAAIGDAQQAPVTIEDFDWSSPSVSVAVTNAVFTLEEVCVTGSTRLVSGDGSFGLKAVRPNPVSTMMEIEYELVEDGPTELFVTNLQGERVAILVNEEAKPGRYVITVDASRLASGSYLYTLRTRTQQLTRRMEVVK